MGIFEKADIVSRNSLDQVTSSRQFAKSYLEVIGIVEGIEKVLVKRVNVLEPGKAFEDYRQLLGEGLLSVSNFASIKASYS